MRRRLTVRRSLPWLLAAVLLLPAAAGGFVRQHREALVGARLFAEVLGRVQRDGLDSLRTDALYEYAARGMVEQLGDPYAELYSPQELARFTRDQLGNAYAGVGMLLEDQLGRPTVSQVYPDTPAERAGVRRGDRVVAVDSLPVRGLPLATVTSRMLGRAGTTVALTVDRAGAVEPLRLRLTRAVVHIPAVPFTLMLDGDVGYVPLTRVNETAAAEVAHSLTTLGRQGARSFVLDLRGNGGGSVDQSLAISELFLPAGRSLASLRLRGDSALRFGARREPLVPSAPVAVLTDGATASAAEIVAGALQDHDRALVVGEPTFGKGLVQTVFPLDGGWALKLTTGRWYTPSGRSIQRDRRRGGDTTATVVAAPVQDTTPGAFRTAAGRPLRGGGGITPDVLVHADSLTAAERRLVQALAPKSRESYLALYELARELRGNVPSNFTVTPAWRAAYRDRLAEAGVRVEPAVLAGATGMVDRMLEQRVASLAFGDSAAVRRGIPFDAPLRETLTLLRGAPTQRALLGLDAGVRPDRG